MYDGNEINQTVIKRKIMAYLRSCVGENKRDEEFIKQFEEGYCGGISSLWLYSKWLQTQINPEDKPRDDNVWFQNIVQSIVTWDEKPFDLSEKARQENPEKYKNDFAKCCEFENFISQIEYFQNTNEYLPSATQGALDLTLEDTKNRKLSKEYSITGLFSLDNLAELLKTENFIQENKLVYITSHNHATALFMSVNELGGNKYCFFDPNSKVGEIQTASPEEVAKMIFKAHAFKNEPLLPFNFIIFSFDKVSKKACLNCQEILDKIFKNKPPLIIEASPDNDLNGYFILKQAVIEGDIESVRYYLKKGADPNLINKHNKTALMLAARYGHVEIVKELLVAKADPNLINKSNKTALMLAAIYGHVEVVKELLAAKADPNLVDELNCTALILAAVYGHVEVVKELLAAKADPNLVGELNCTALMVAAVAGHVEVIKALLATGKISKKNIQDVIDEAVAEENKEVIKLFLPNIKANSFKSSVINGVGFVVGSICIGVAMVAVSGMDVVAVKVVSAAATFVGTLLCGFSAIDQKNVISRFFRIKKIEGKIKAEKSAEVVSKLKTSLSPTPSTAAVIAEQFGGRSLEKETSKDRVNDLKPQKTSNGQDGLSIKERMVQNEDQSYFKHKG